MLAKPLTPAEHARAAVVVALDAEDDEMSRGALIAAASRLKPMPRETFVAAIDLLVRDGAVLESVGLYRLAPRDGD